MNIFAPSGAKKGSKLPVYFFIQGGGFNTNSNANYNGSGLVTASGMNIVVVNFNYRGMAERMRSEALGTDHSRSGPIWLPDWEGSGRGWRYQQWVEGSAAGITVS